MTSPLTVPNSLVLGFIVVVLCVSCQYETASGAVPPRNRDYSRQNELEPITLEDILQGTLSGRSFSGQWVEGSDNLVRTFKPDAVINYNVADGSNATVLNITELQQRLKFENIIFSNDGKFALLEHGKSSLWRYSSLAKYDIYNINSGELIKLETNLPGEEQPLIQLVKWTPGNGIVFVYDYNIYYREDAANSTKVRKITDDGADNKEKAIYNGISDWVYEADTTTMAVYLPWEMFGGPTAMWVSPSGNNLAFVKFNDKDVLEFQWPIYGDPGSNESYPTYRKIRYPKAGTPNPAADVYIVSLTDESSQPVKLTYKNSSNEDPDRHIIGTALWASDTQLMVVTLNRVQTKSQWHLCTSNSIDSCNKVYTYQLDRGWVDMNTPKISKDGTKFLLYRSVLQVNMNESYNHVVMFKSDGSSMPLTTGRLSVTSILGWDETNKKVYFSGSFWNTTHADHTESQVYFVADDGQNTVPTCITCSLKNSFGGLCRENSVTFSANFTYFIHRCSGPDVPETTTRTTKDGTVIANPGPTLVNNAAIREALSKKAVPITREYIIPVEGGFTAKAWLYLPPNFNSSKKYPLLISVYGGPGSQSLTQSYGISWEMSMVSQKDIIFGKIDGRGTSKQSTDYLYTLHRSLGTAEIEDQIAVTKWLVEHEPLIDPNRTSIWGWSYGGYATAKVLEKDIENVFKCGISVAPVTNWRYYDTIYTERYMGLPTDNYEGYNESDVTLHVGNLRNKQYMLVHGNADDNVHYQQSMILARAMEKEDIFFYQLSYPDENHGISGPGMRKHLYHSLERFLFDECYKTSESDDGGKSGATVTSSSVFGLMMSCVFVLYRIVF